MDFSTGIAWASRGHCPGIALASPGRRRRSRSHHPQRSRSRTRGTEPERGSPDPEPPPPSIQNYETISLNDINKAAPDEEGGRWAGGGGGDIHIKGISESLRSGTSAAQGVRDPRRTTVTFRRHHPTFAAPAELATGATDPKETSRQLNVWGTPLEGEQYIRQPNF